MKLLTAGEIEENSLDPVVDAVLISWDPSFSFYSLCVVTMYLQKGIRVYAVSDENHIILPDGSLVPGTNSLLKQIDASLGPLKDGHQVEIVNKIL